MKTKENIYTLSNGLSFLRLLMTIPFWFLLDFFHEDWGRLSLIFLALIGALTDWLDGYFARKLNQVTEFGKIIDPIADKICIGGMIIKMYLIGVIDPLLFYLIIGRDVLIFVAGVFLSYYLNKVLPSNILGKITVSSIALYILIVFLQIDSESMVKLSVYFTTIILIIVSIVAYAIRAIEFIRLKGNETI
jgi:CDP-diacylglycerol--glycerol-3-phosphate 3-phosphatidyltransferase